MSNRRSSDDLRSVQDKLRLANFIEQKQAKIRAAFDRFMALLDEVKESLGQEAEEDAREHFGKELAEGAIAIAKLRLPREPESEDELRFLEECIDKGGASDAFARLEGLLGKSVERGKAK